MAPENSSIVAFRSWSSTAGSCTPVDQTDAFGVELSEGWQNLVAVDRDAMALDLGFCGGPLSLSLAEKVAHVYALEPDGARLKKLADTAQQRCLANVHFVQGGDALPLPFPDRYFDLVNLGSALEFLPCRLPGNPRRVQIQVLEEVRRILKPTGQVYAAMENRFAMRFFYGGRQDANGLPWVTLLPRWLADGYYVLTRRKAYRGYTHSGPGCRRLFRQAGFASVQALGLSDPVRFEQVTIPGQATPVESLFPSRSRWKGVIKKVCRSVGVLSWLVPAYGVVASPEHGRSCFLTEMLDHLSRETQTNYRIAKALTRDYGGCVLMLDPEDTSAPGAGAVLKMAFAEGREQLLERTARNAEALARTLPSSNLVPRTLRQGTFKGHAFLLEERFAGINGVQMIERGWPRDRLLEAVWAILEPWMQATRHAVRMNQAEFDCWVPYQADVWRRLAGPQTKTLERLLGVLGQFMVGQERVMVASHGDLWLENVLFDEATGTVVGIVDWASADREGLPLVDALNMNQHRASPEFHLGFPDGYAAGRPVEALAEGMRRFATLADDPHLARIRAAFGYPEDRDGVLALFILFLKKHQNRSLTPKKLLWRWIEAFGLLLEK